jgi:uncharacterized membrane protein YbhN (UPF0104 family)
VTKRPLIGALKIAGCMGALALFVRSVAGVDVHRAWAILEHAGPLVLLCGLPYALAVAVDSLAWRQLFASLGSDVKHGKLFIVRLALEAVSMSLPAGAVIAESLTPSLLARHTGVATSTSVAAMAGKKWLTMRSHGIYVAVSAVVGFAVLSRISRGVLGVPGLPFLVLVLACVPAALSLALEASLGRGAIVGRIHDALRRLPIARLRTWLDERRSGFANADTNLVRIVSDRGNSGRATLLYVLAWSIEAIETLVILRVLGANVGIVEVVSIEAGLSVVRSLAFFAPAGLGVQDVGYVACFAALGLPEAGALATAFVLIKRSKELLWVAIGYGVLFASSARRGTTAIALRSLPAR